MSKLRELQGWGNCPKCDKFFHRISATELKRHKDKCQGPKTRSQYKGTPGQKGKKRRKPEHWNKKNK